MVRELHRPLDQLGDDCLAECLMNSFRADEVYSMTPEKMQVTL